MRHQSSAIAKARLREILSQKRYRREDLCRSPRRGEREEYLGERRKEEKDINYINCSGELGTRNYKESTGGAGKAR